MYDTRESYLSYGGIGGREDFAADPAGTTYQQEGWYLGEPLLDVPPSYTPIADLLDAGRDPVGYIPAPRIPEDDGIQPPVGFDLPGSRRPVPHRRRRPRPQLATWPQITSSLFGVLTTCTVTAVSLLGWIFSYAPLQRLAAAHVAGGLAQLWPIIIYGPWFVASLSILRAALDRRRIAHSWVVLGVFSGMAAVLCVASASPTLSDVIVSGLPPITAVISFHQLIRQMTATRRARHGPTSPPPRQPAKSRR